MEIEDKEQLAAFLLDRPVELSVVIAVRSVLRVLPTLSTLVGPLPDADRDVHADIVLPIFRAIATSLAVAKYPARSVVLAHSADVAAFVVANSPSVVSSVAYAAATAANVAYASASGTGTNDDLAAAAFTAGDAADNASAAYPAAAVWYDVRADLSFFESDKSISRLAVSPLLRETYDDLLTQWQHLASYLAGPNNWAPWLEWYEDILHGRPVWGLSLNAAEELEARILTQDDEWWGRDVATVNGDIAAWVEESKSNFKPELTMSDFVLRELARREKPLLIEDFVQAFQQAGHRSSRTSVRGRLNELTAKGRILRVGRGLYAALPDTHEQSPGTWDFFLSYSTTDEPEAKKICGVVEAAGYSVFVQFKDMPPGSNFVREMQNGLANTSRFIAVISANYVASDMCQAEWAAAFNVDPSGRKRKIVPFLLQPTELDPLSKQIVYVPLFGLSEEEAANKIREALKPWVAPTQEQSRKVARDMSSPKVVLDDHQRLDAVSDEAINAPFVDEELPKLPDRVRRLIGNLLKTIAGSNAPAIVRTSLESYLSELDKGFDFEITFLEDDIEAFKAEMSADQEEIWCKGGLKKSCERLVEIHDSIKAHYPLDMGREQHIDDAPINSGSFDDDNFVEQQVELTTATVAAIDDGIVTQAFSNVVEHRARQFKDIQSLSAKPRVADEDLFLSGQDRVMPEDVKKRFLFQVSGFLDGVLDKSAKITTVSQSEAGKSVLNAAKRILDIIWS